MKEPTDPTLADGSGAMFDSIAKRYDLLNHLMTFGLHHRWRKSLVRAMELDPSSAHVLDVATGTADVAIALCQSHANLRVTGIDPSVGMLQVGHRKIARAACEQRIELLCGDAQKLPFADATFDGVCISFGIRNVENRLLGLQEMIRVCKPAAKVVVLELGEPQTGWLSLAARWYIHHVVPTLGAWISGAAQYRYLQRSIAAFPQPPVFAQLMQQAGLVNVQVTRLSFGAVFLYSGQKPRH